MVLEMLSLKIQIIIIIIRVIGEKDEKRVNPHKFIVYIAEIERSFANIRQ